MLSNATNQPKSTVELGYMCPRGLSGPPAVIFTISELSIFLELVAMATPIMFL